MATNKNMGLPEPDSRGALRRMIIVLAFAIGIAIYSYGWTATEINLEVPQEERRQTNVTRAMRELLSPRIFDQERTLATFEAPFLMNCEMGEAPAQADPASGDTIVVVEPACANAGDTITVYVYNGSPDSESRIRWMPPATEGEEVNERPMTVLETGREDFVLANSGNFTGTITVPRIRAGDGQVHSVRVLVAVPSGPIVFSDTANLVIDRMVQTIFMALVATTVAIPIAVLISFFAARNLMKRVHLSVGSMLLSFIAFSAGIWLGGGAISELGKLGVAIGRGSVFAPVGALMAFVIPGAVLFGTITLLRRLALLDNGKEKHDMGEHVPLAVANTIITALAAIFLTGAVAGLGMLGGEQISNLGSTLRPADSADWLMTAISALISSFGNLLHTLGRLVELFLGTASAVITGFALSGIIGTIFGNALRRIQGVPSHVLGAILGGISGALIMALATSFGSWAALLGVLPLLAGGILGGNVALQIYARTYQKGPRPRHFIRGESNFRQLSKTLVFMVGAVIVGVYLFDLLRVGRSMVDGTLPLQAMAHPLGIELPITVYMFDAMLVGLILGAISGGMASLQGVFPLGDTLYNTARTTLNIVRSIEPLIMGLVFVIWVGIGPFAGVLALTLHSIASLGKLYSEQIENIDPGPIEALESTGANQLQTIVYAVVPQIIPPYIAFTMYRWDINVRMSTIIGFVGGGGIGLLLQQQINLLRYRDAGVAVLAIAVVVSVLDYASATIRERMT